ncbi:MAG: GTPase RsgA [Comamonadaceae bacterium]|nr:GTPase RsgA [Comamonadaceae bacterium]
MGKSTLVNALVPDARCRHARNLRRRSTPGKHTTTFSRLYRLDRASALIDSPGLQVFGLAHLVAPGRRDTPSPSSARYLGHCRFRDCRHDAEPGCALRAAVQQGDAGRAPARPFPRHRQRANPLTAACAPIRSARRADLYDPHYWGLIPKIWGDAIPWSNA